MMESAEHGYSGEVTACLDSTSSGRILAERKVGTRAVIVSGISL